MVMPRLAVDQNYVWVQPKTLQRRYEMRSNDQVWEALEFQSAFGSLAVAESADGRWTFKRVGFFNPRVTIRQEGDETNLAVYKPNWMGEQGVLQFLDGRVFTWKTANFWATRFLLLDARGALLLGYQSGGEESKLSDLFKVQARVEIEPPAWNVPELSLLILLGWYLIVLRHEDTAVVAAVAT